MIFFLYGYYYGYYTYGYYTYGYFVYHNSGYSNWHGKTRFHSGYIRPSRG
jgi:hypothetical protein